MVCACHRHGLFAMTRTNHTLPTERSNGAEINSTQALELKAWAERRAWYTLSAHAPDFRPYSSVLTNSAEFIECYIRNSLCVFFLTHEVDSLNEGRTEAVNSKIAKNL